jgi:hypothetical protein
MHGFLSFEEALTHQLLMMNYNEMGEGQTFSILWRHNTVLRIEEVTRICSYKEGKAMTYEHKVSRIVVG